MSILRLRGPSKTPKEGGGESEECDPEKKRYCFCRYYFYKTVVTSGKCNTGTGGLVKRNKNWTGTVGKRDRKL